MDIGWNIIAQICKFQLSVSFSFLSIIFQVWPLCYTISTYCFRDTMQSKCCFCDHSKGSLWANKQMSQIITSWWLSETKEERKDVCDQHYKLIEWEGLIEWSEKRYQMSIFMWEFNHVQLSHLLHKCSNDLKHKSTN